MKIEDEILLLFRVKNVVWERHGFSKNVDIRPIAEELGLDLDKIMKDIIKICETQDYNVGCHMYCTRANVIPQYRESGKLVLDKDHIEGLAQILAVHSGIRDDY